MSILAYTYACGHEYQTMVDSPHEAKTKRSKAAAEICPQCQENASIPEALRGIASALRDLGNADASTPMGAIEALGAVIAEGLNSVASAISEHVEAVRDLAEAIKERKP